MRNSNTKITHSVKNIGCPHIHTYTLTQSKFNVCFNCLMIYYSNCEYRKIEDKVETIQSIKILQTYFDDIKITAQNNRLDIHFCSIFDEFSAFTSDLDLLSNRLEIAIKHNNFIEFSVVKEEALKLMKKLENSQTMSVYAKHQAHSLLDKRVNGFSEIYNLSNSLSSKDKNILPEIDQPHNSKEENKANTTNNHTTMKENYEEKVDELTSKIYSLAEEKKTLESTVQNLIKSNKEVKEKYIKLESKMENFNNLYIEKERIIENLEEEIKNCDIEVDRRSHSWSVDKNSFTDLYISKIGCNIAAKDANIEIELNLSNQSHLDMLSILKCIKLPNMKRIRIDKLKNCSKEFLQFLTCSMPNNLQLISLNRSQSALLDAEFYMKGLQRITQVVTKEIYLTCFNFTNENLANFIKSCVNTSRLIFTCCNFDFDTELDFCGPEYKLEYLCFWCCKCYKNNWNTKPERFERIVKAISESGLKDSLKTLNISSSSNLTADQVSVMLKNYKIEHINISTIDSNEPLVF